MAETITLMTLEARRWSIDHWIKCANAILRGERRYLECSVDEIMLDFRFRFELPRSVFENILKEEIVKVEEEKKLIIQKMHELIDG